MTCALTSLTWKALTYITTHTSRRSSRANLNVDVDLFAVVDRDRLEEPLRAGEAVPAVWTCRFVDFQNARFSLPKQKNSARGDTDYEGYYYLSVCTNMIGRTEKAILG